MMDTHGQKHRNNLPLDIGKLPPMAIEFEEAVIGGLLLEKDAIYHVAHILRPENFYKDEHQKIYKSILLAFTSNKPIDLLTIADFLRKEKELEDIGGPAYLSQLTGCVATATHIEYHAMIIKQKYMAREFIRINTEAANKSFDESLDIDDVISFHQQEIYKLLNDFIGSGVSQIGEIGVSVLKELQEISKNVDLQTGILSGFRNIDSVTSGWQDSDLIIVGARPSMGKTQLALKFAINPVINQKKKILFISLEMSKKQLYLRLLSQLTGIENGFMRSGQLDVNDWQRIEEAQLLFENMGLYVEDTPNLNIIDFRAIAMKEKNQKGIDMIIVDYLQLMRSSNNNAPREQQVTEISRNLKSVAKQLNIPIIALAQVGRGVEQRGGDKKPELSDLRESGSIEADADLIMFIHRPEYYGFTEDEDGNSLKQLIQILLKKHRNGPLGEFSLWRSKNWSDIKERLDRINEVEDGEMPDLFPDQKQLSSGDDTFKPDIDDETPF